MTQIHWANPVKGLFTTAVDWSGGVVPAASDDAVLDAAGSKFTVKVKVLETVNSLQLAANATLDISGVSFTASAGTGSGANAGTIRVSNNATFSLAGAVNNVGAIDLEAKNRFSILHIGAAGATLSGGGRVTLSDSPDNEIDAAVAGTTILTNVDNTISGAGLIAPTGYGNHLILDNRSGGVVEATGVNAMLLDGETAINAGLLEATGAGGLSIRGAVNNAGGVILAGAGSKVVLFNATLSGGALSTSGAGVITVWSGCALDGATSILNNTGRVNVTQGAGLDLRGEIANAGTITFDYLGGGLSVGAAGATLSGGGSIVMRANNEIGADVAGAVLTNVDNTISGAGQLGGYHLSLVNQAGGVVDGAGMVIGGAAGDTITNAGLLEATGTVGLTVNFSEIDNTATGVILAGAGSRVAFNGVDIAGGTLQSSGGGSGIVFSSGANELDGAAGAVTNQASVSVAKATSLTLQGAIINSGKISLSATRQAATLVVGAVGVTLSGGGVISLGGGSDVIEGATAAARLTNLDNTLYGSGRLGDGQMTLVNRSGGVIEATSATVLTLDTGANAVVNAGLIEALGPTAQAVIASAVKNTGTLAAAGGTLTVNGTVSGNGGAVINAGTLYFASSFNQNVTFAGTAGVLELGQSETFTKTVTGFSAAGGTSLDLRDIAFVGSGEATFSGTTTGGVLTVTDGTGAARIKLVGDYTGSTFVASDDGQGGTIVIDPAGGPPAVGALRFIAAVAGLNGSLRPAMSETREFWRRSHPALASPRAMIA